jgi:hypothetical protein
MIKAFIFSLSWAFVILLFDYFTHNLSMDTFTKIYWCIASVTGYQFNLSSEKWLK